MECDFLLYASLLLRTYTHDIQSTHEESISTYTLHSNLKLGTHLTVVVELTVT